MDSIFFDWKTSNALNKIEALKDIEFLYVATAFLEQQGVNWISQIAQTFVIPKNRIRLFVSIDFSLNRPSFLLEQLDSFATIYIVTKQKLHAKTILAVNKDGIGKVMHGSANLTHMGMNHNLELSSVLDVNVSKHGSNTNIHQFFERLVVLSDEVTPDIIARYQEREKVIDSLPFAQEAENSIFKPVFADDKAIPSAEELEGFYFTHQDYETLLESNAPLVTQGLRNGRETIRNKLLDLHDQLADYAKGLGLHSHWDSNHKVSQIEPNQFNFGRVNWMAVRFGKHRTELDGLLPKRAYREKEIYKFPKHGCIQMSVTQNGLSVGLFHAVRYDSWDRAYVAGKLEKTSDFIRTITSHLKDIQGYGYRWFIHDPTTDRGTSFSIDDESLDDFPAFYRNDEDGFESFLTTTYEHNHEEIETVDDIVNLIKFHMDLLLPLYKSMVQVPQKI
ncbi:hypothetical protein [Paenibacillus tundrae]